MKKRIEYKEDNIDPNEPIPAYAAVVRPTSSSRLV